MKYITMFVQTNNMHELSTITLHITVVMALGSLMFCFENAFVFSPRLK